jgi:hypothetical protein
VRPKNTLLGRHGKVYEVVVYATRDNGRALVRDPSDGEVIALYYEDLAPGQGKQFYGLAGRGNNKAMTARLREMRASLPWKGEPPTEPRTRYGKEWDEAKIEAHNAAIGGRGAL